MKVFVHPAISRSHAFEGEALGDVLPEDEAAITFPTLRLAAKIMRERPLMAARLLHRSEMAKRSVWSEMITDRSALLSPEGIYATWGSIRRGVLGFFDIFPQGLFIRPDSGNKPFTGFAALDKQEALIEINTRSAVSADEMCFIAPFAQIHGAELRIWLTRGQIVTSAPYGWNENDEQADISWLDEAMRSARVLAADLEQVDEAFVLDFAMSSAGPKLVELNSYATSGWYAKAEPRLIMEAARELFS